MKTKVLSVNLFSESANRVLRQWSIAVFMFLAMFLLMGFTSCSDDDNEVVDTDTTEIVTLSTDTLSASFYLNELAYRIVLLNSDDIAVGVNQVYAYVLRESADGLQTITHPEDYEIEVYPYMPGMGHSSPNNEDFVWNTDLQTYQGTLNFTMSGLWQVFLTLKKGDEVLAEQIIWTIQLGSMSM